MTGSDLTRRTTGLSPAHVALLKLLAELAVKDYFREFEIESNDKAAQNTGELHEEKT